MSGAFIDGFVIKLQSGYYSVQTASDLITCQLRGRLKKKAISEDLVAVGDQVQISLINHQEGTIEKIKPRVKMLVRSAPTPRGEYKQILLANLDLVVFVFACTQPIPHLRMLDRFLVIAEKQEIPALIIVNKVDLVGEEQAKKIFSVYPTLGYSVIYTSARTSLGLNEFKHKLKGKISAMTGPSGTGKTSLLNLLQPGLGLKVREVSRSTTKGRHSTVVRELFPIGGNGFLADLPGIRSLTLWDVNREELDGYFPEIRDLVSKCRFNNCSHRDEPGCAIKVAVQTGQIHTERYQSYLKLRESIKATNW